MAYRSQQRPMPPAQARAAQLSTHQQTQQQLKMLRVSGALVGLTLAVGGLLTALRSWL